MLFDTASSLESNRKRFRPLLRKRGIDFTLLGIGKNGHIAFNEPGAKNSGIHVAKLSKSTRNANMRSIKGRKPSKAMTLGMSDIMKSRKIVLAASGKGKARAIKQALQGKAGVPASALMNHRNTEFALDKQAAKLL